MNATPSAVSRVVNGITFDKMLSTIHFTPNNVNGRVSVSALYAMCGVERCLHCDTPQV
jgi:hypothetical protein